LVAGSTQETFSRQCGVSLTTLAAIERDQRRPSARELAQIAKTFSREFLRTHAAA
jgi:transcriptional regulator with XRE-family HTH domain